MSAGLARAVDRQLRREDQLEVANEGRGLGKRLAGARLQKGEPIACRMPEDRRGVGAVQRSDSIGEGLDIGRCRQAEGEHGAGRPVLFQQHPKSALGLVIATGERLAEKAEGQGLIGREEQLPVRLVGEHRQQRAGSIVRGHRSTPRPSQPSRSGRRPWLTVPSDRMMKGTAVMCRRSASA